MLNFDLYHDRSPKEWTKAPKVIIVNLNFSHVSQDQSMDSQQFDNKLTVCM